MKRFDRDMGSHLYGNPHSHSPSSELSSAAIENARRQALAFFKADPEYFDLIFVANATAAIKLVMDCMSDYSRPQGGFWYGYHRDCHTSLVGIREVATQGSCCFQDDEAVDDWLYAQETSGSMKSEAGPKSVNLFAFPGQSNMNGRRLPLAWPQRVRSSASHASEEIYSLLDAAALVATAPLDLSDPEKAPDFTALSFYKIFGFPDLGALIVRKAAGHVLGQRRYFGGGTVDMVINGSADDRQDGGWYAKKSTSLHEMLEDGTPAFHSIAALSIGIDVHRQLFGSMSNVTKHASALVKYVYDEMSTLTHANETPLCHIYKDPSSTYGDSKSQGPTVAFNLRDSSGTWIGKSDVETLAIINNLQIRTGGLCNPGGIAASLRISPTEMRENYEEGVRCGGDIDEMHGKSTGVVRVSLGAMSSKADVDAFLGFLQLFVDTRPPRSPLRPESSSEKSPVRAAPMEIKTSCLKVEETELEEHTCPVASCKGIFQSKDKLLAHLPDHRINQKRRYLWRSS